MKTKNFIPCRAFALALMVGAFANDAAAQVTNGHGPLFTYQGLLTESNRPANGLYDLQFALYAAATNSIPPLGSVVTISNVAVINGVFTAFVPLNELSPQPDPPGAPPPPGSFAMIDDEVVWIEILVRPAGSQEPFLLIGPRQKVTHAPRAAYAGLAREALTVPDGSLTAVKFGSNSVTSAALAFGAVRTDNLENYSVTFEKLASGAIPHSCFDYTNCYWSLFGNGNITAGVNFLGTVAGELDPLEFRVNNNRAMLYVFTGADTSPNLIGGFKHNIVNGVGGTIGGGGQASAVHVVNADWGTIGGGYTNRIDGAASTIAGGFNNYSAGYAGAIGGGAWNTIQPLGTLSTIGGGSGNAINATWSTIPGGRLNSIQYAESATIGGGRDNTIYSNVYAGTISGGEGNKIYEESRWSTIGGGSANHINPYAAYGAIGGGQFNLVNFNATHGVIGGGYSNKIETATQYATVGGGAVNTIEPSAAASAIGGGYHNLIQSNALNATIAGGYANTVGTNAACSAIGGGHDNVIQTSAAHSTIGGGTNNLIQTGAESATIGGGHQNTVQADADYAALGGGQYNTAGAWWSTVAGGVNNTASGAASSVGGGNFNAASGGDATIAGGFFNSAAGWRGAMGGGAVNKANGDYGTIGGGLSNQVYLTAGSGTIGGGVANTIWSGSSSCTIAGGTHNQILTNANHSTVAGGVNNTIDFNTYSAAIGGGRANAASGESATIAGGASNLTSLPYSTVGGGAGNWAIGWYSTVPGGAGARAQEHGQMAYASGSFSQVGDAQSSLFVLRQTTTDGATNELFLDGSAARMYLSSPGRTWVFDILVTARSSTGNSAGYRIQGVIENVAGTVAFVGTPTTTTLGEDVASWHAFVAALDPPGALAIKVMGSAGQTVRWVASVRTAEVISP
jgi:hypothetical protein